MCRTCRSSCEQRRTRLERHPLEQPPSHTRDRKGLRDTRQADDIGPFRKSQGKQHVSAEVRSGLVQAEAFSRATSANTLEALKMWFCFSPKPLALQSDNGSHFTAPIVQEWAKEEGIQCIFHTPYSPQANGIVERTDGLLKRFLKPQNSNWTERLWDAVKTVHDRWGVNGCPRLTAFYPQPPSLIPATSKPTGNQKPARVPGQPVLVELPTAGAVPMVLAAPLNMHTWKAKDASGKEHKISSRWIIPTFSY